MGRHSIRYLLLTPIVALTLSQCYLSYNVSRTHRPSSDTAVPSSGAISVNDAPKEEETGPAVDDDDDDNEKKKSDEEDGGNGDSDDEEVNEAAKQQAKKDSKTVRAMRKHNLGRTQRLLMHHSFIMIIL